MNANMEEKKALIKEADLLKMISNVIKKWKFVVVVACCFALFGIIIAFSTAKSYTVAVVVAPEASGESVSGINSLASIVGVDFGLSAEGDAIYPLLYPDVVSSLPFLTSLFDVRVKNLEETVDTTYYAYLRHYRERTWLDYVKMFPSRVMNSVKRIFISSPDVPVSHSFNPYMLSEKQMGMVENLNSAISVFVDKKTNVTTLSFTDRDSRVAATMADTIMNRLQHEITLYRTKKAIDDCAYIERMCSEAKDSLDVSQKRYADFITHNRNIRNEYAIAEKERLEADKNLKTALYTQWAQQYLLAKAKVKEKTPVFVTLEPATIPVKASSMGRLAKIVLYTIIGAVLAVLYVLAKDSVLESWHKIIGTSK